MMKPLTVTLLTAALLACRDETPARNSPDPRPPPKPGVNAPPVARSCGERTITGSGLGDLAIGSPVEDVRSRCTILHDTTALREEGMPARVVSVAFGTDTVEAEVVEGKIWRIEINHPGFQTRDSLAVGTPLSRLADVPGIHSTYGEGHVFVLSPAHCGLSFGLSRAGTRALPPEMDRAEIRRLPPGIVISRILIVGCRAK